MRHDKLYLRDIVEAADAVARFTEATSQDEFVANDLVRSAVLQKLTILGEAAARLSPDLRARYPRVEWGDIVAFRNMAVHAYFGVRWETVWAAATEDTPVLRGQVAEILRKEFPQLAPDS